MVACDECEYREIVGQNKFCRFHSSYIGWHGCENGKCKPITNADHIRSMSDEELAVWIAETSNCSDWCKLSNECEKKQEFECCINVWLDWLKKEVKE